MTSNWLTRVLHTRCRTLIGNKVRNYFCNRQRIAKDFYLFFSNTIVTPHSACRESHKSHKSSQRVSKKAKRPYIYCVCSYLSFSTTPLSFLYRGCGGKFSLSRFFFALLKHKLYAKKSLIIALFFAFPWKYQK